MQDKISNENVDRDRILIQQALRTSNDLHGNDIMSSHEIAKGYTRPVIEGGFPFTVRNELIKAHESFLARHNFTLILISKSRTDIEINICELVQVFIKQPKDKREK